MKTVTPSVGAFTQRAARLARFFGKEVERGFDANGFPGIKEFIGNCANVDM